ncbi:MAG: GIY-YIG nuclease family protein [Candidatus Kerfeldbacteria bacterium]|nr:GIY-YIG nuclease family protein [Candidatus Kerfeldbacteria bacterium]
MYYVYLLVNGQGKRYVGSAININIRLQRHNSGKIHSTKKYLPWTLVYFEAYATEALARQREKNLKQHGNAKREMFKRAGIMGKESI